MITLGPVDEKGWSLSLWTASVGIGTLRFMNAIPSVEAPLGTYRDQAWNIWNHKVKPQLSLGRLEHLVVDIVDMTGSLHPQLGKPQLLLFAADHGVVAQGVSSSPQEITWQQCENFVRGGGAVGLLCQLNNLSLHVIDVGVAHDFSDNPKILSRKVAWGTQNFSKFPAMSAQQMWQALQVGMDTVQELVRLGHRTFAFGEMGIGNTTSASALMACRTGKDVQVCTGRGAGLDDAGLQKKQAVIASALALHGRPTDPLEALQCYGGFEIAALAGAMLAAASQRCVLLIDGFITTVAAEIAVALRPEALHYMIFCHESKEVGHRHLLELLQVQPLLSLRMHLGEGSGAAVAWPLIRNALALYEQMESFSAAQVTDSVSLLHQKGIDARLWERN